MHDLCLCVPKNRKYVHVNMYPLQNRMHVNGLAGYPGKCFISYNKIFKASEETWV